MNNILDAGLQKELDLLDERIDTLQREKEAAGDHDRTRDVEEAREVQQMAREDYSRGVLPKAFNEVDRAKYCLLLGWEELAKHKVRMDELKVIADSCQ